MLYYMSHNVPKLLASLRSYRPDGWRLAVMTVLVGNLMMFAARFTTQVDLAAIADGDISASWELLVSLIVFSALIGFGAGVVDTTKFEDLVATLPDSPMATLIMRSARLIRTVVVLMANAPAAPLVVVARVSQRYNPFISLRLPLLSPDLWPTGASPRLIYESA